MTHFSIESGFKFTVNMWINTFKPKNLLKILIDNLNKLDKEKPYIIYCMSGNRSLKASHVMKSLGFKMIYHYKKGYKDWIKD